MDLRHWIGALIVLLGAPAIAVAATIHVPEDQPTIQEGINAASPGDTVVVDCGTYYEHGITMRAGVCLRSVTGDPDCVTIDAEHLSRVMQCQYADKGTVLSGLTFTRGFATYGEGRYSFRGGGLYLTDSLAGPEVVDCVFLENESVSYGGGVHCGTSGEPVFRRCKFIRNSCINSGGGVFSIYGSGKRCSPTFEECVFDGNTSAELGGGCGSFGDRRAVVQFRNCDFIGNDADSGGAVHAHGCQLTVDGCLFVGNTASFYFGGALRMFRCPWADISGSTIVANSAFVGSGVHAAYTPLEVDRTIIAFGEGGAGVSCSDGYQAWFTCSDVYGNEGGDWVGCIEGQNLINGNLCSDPLLCGEQNPDLPYSIRTDSPCAPGGNTCGVLIGCRDVGCGPSTVSRTSWGRLKALHR